MTVKEKLLKEYGKLINPSETTCIKYRLKYNDVNVNVYFDAYDKNNLSLFMVLNYYNNYYYTSLNANYGMKKEYLDFIPKEILAKILNENRLDCFFNFISTKVYDSTPKIVKYNKDILFKNTLKYAKQKKRKDLPFFSHLRKANMTEKAFVYLNETMGINREVLKEIKNSGMTVVRTENPKRRKNLIVSLKDK